MTIITDIWICIAGGGERSGAGDPVHLQCVVGVPYLLAHLCYHGCPTVRWQILQGN